MILHAGGNTPEAKTVVVLGVARSGTSMVAKVLENLGVFMGHEKDEAVFEDLQIARMLEGPFDKKNLKLFIEDRNQRYVNWGFKRPIAYRYFFKYADYFRNLHYVVPFRDMLAIAQRNSTTLNANFFRCLEQSNREYNELIRFVIANEKPMLLFSYEKALIKKEEFVNLLVRFLGISPSEEMIGQALASIEFDNHKYLISTRIDRFEGLLESYRKGRVTGWAKCFYSDTPIMLDIIVNGHIVKTFEASLFRKDLKKLNIGHGQYGFHEAVGTFLVKGENTIRVAFHHNQKDIDGSPLVISS